jgi:flagellar biosynthetic protein FlhB
MARDGKTEKATPKRLNKERMEGNVSKSKDLTIFFNVLALTIFLFLLGPWFVKKLIGFQQLAFSILYDPIEPVDFGVRLGKESAMIILPIAVMMLFFQLGNYYFQTRFLIAWKSIKPNFKKMNLFGYVKGVFSRKSLIDVLKSFLILFVLGYTCYGVFRSEIATISSAMLLPWQQSLLFIWSILRTILIKILISLFVIGVADYIYQKWEYANKLKMSKAEVKEEAKQADRDPKMKSRQRQFMLGMLRKEIVTKVPDATFILVNPTHFAVAVRYKRGLDPVPIVLVKGVDHMALLIKEIAKQNKVPVHHYPELARELYQRVNENEFIPEDMFLAVIGVMKHLIQTKEIKMG